MSSQALKKSDSRVSNIALANNLSYQPSAEISVVVQRNMKRYDSTRDSYNASQTVQVRLPTGESYISGRTSWVSFVLTAENGANPAKLSAGGSCLDVIQEVVWNHQSGKEIYRNPKFNLYNRITQRYKQSQGRLETVGQITGFNTDSDVTQPGGIRFSFPLSMLGDIFDSSQLLPPWLVSGSRLDISLDTVQKALYSVTTDATSFTVTDFQLHLDSVILSDAVHREMLSQVSNGNVVMEFNNYRNHENASGAASSAYQIDTQESVSRALGVVGCARLATNVNISQGDSLAPDEAELNYLQSRLGALVFPERPLTNTNDIYMYALRTMGRLNSKGMETSVRYTDFVGAASQVPGAATVYNSELISVYLQKSDFLLASGIPTNRQSGSVIVSARYASSKDRVVDLFVIFLTSLKIGANNILIGE